MNEVFLLSTYFLDLIVRNTDQYLINLILNLIVTQRIKTELNCEVLDIITGVNLNNSTLFRLEVFLNKTKAYRCHSFEQYRVLT